MNQNSIRKLVYSGVCLALALILPAITGQIPQIGAALSPMHIAGFLCGMTCGGLAGMIVGLTAPFLRFAIFGMPPVFPTGIGMALELAAYGFLSGILYRKFPKRLLYIYVNLIISMLGGRIVWGLTRYFLAELFGLQFSFEMFWAGAFLNAIPGIILQVVVIPLIVGAMEKSGLISK